MLTQAARRRSMSKTASFSALSRSGRLVTTSKLSIGSGSVRHDRRHALVHARVAQPHAQLGFHARVDQTARFAHEGQQSFGDGARLRRRARYARRARQTRPIGHQIEVIAHFDFAVVARIVYAAGRAPFKRRQADASEVVGMDVILSLIHISEPTRLGMISYAVFCLK